MAFNLCGATLVLIIRSANWKVHAEEFESFSCVSGKIVRDNLSFLFVLEFNAYFSESNNFGGS